MTLFAPLRLTIGALALACSTLAAAAPTQILFVGNSYTFGRVDPVMSYNAANVHDLTAGFYAANQSGANAWEPHPWGGIAGIFKQFTVEQGLDYDVSISARNAASLRGHFLNTANADWDLRGNVASKKWDAVVLQEQSDATLPYGSGKNANPLQFRAYADKLEQFVHNGAAQSYTETAMYGSLANCQKAGGSVSSCNQVRTIGANPNANANAKVYLTETWARPDMVFAHLNTAADPTSPTGSPLPVSPSSQATLYYQSLAAMSKDLHDSTYGEAAANGHFAGVIGVGDAFQLALDAGLVKSDGFYDANGVFVPNQPGDLMNLWWDDYLHASKYGSYLDALVQFGTITGFDPRLLGAGEIAARDLGISQSNAQALQLIAARQLGFATTAVPEPASMASMALGLGLLAARRRRSSRR
jgi:hypothetical protein